MATLPDRVRFSSHRSTLADAVVCVVAGASAFVAGFAVTYLVEGAHVRSPSKPVYEFLVFGIDSHAFASVGPDGPLPSAYEFAAWQYHSLHGGGIEFGATPAPARALVFVPLLGLLAAGAFVVTVRGAVRPKAAVLRGASVTLGYLPFAVITAVTTQWAPPESVRVVERGVEAGTHPLGQWVGGSLGPQTPEAVLLTGLVVPVVFGAVGGGLALAWREGSPGSGRFLRGGVCGAVAFAVGWCATALGTGGHRGPSVDSQLLGQVWSTTAFVERPPHGVEADPITFATWQYHSLHGATIDAQFTGSLLDVSDGIAVGPGSAFAFAVTMLLAVAGAAAVRRSDVADPVTGAATGSLVVVGYLPLAAMTAFDSAWSPSQASYVLAPVFVDAVLLTGVAVPGLFGAVGGAVAAYASAGLPAPSASLPRL